MSRRLTPSPWTPPPLADFEPGVRVLALDQTLSHCGLADFRILHDEDFATGAYGPCQVAVHHRETIHPYDGGGSGFAGTYHKAGELKKALAVIRDHLHPRARVVYEMPAVAGRRTESSFLAGYVVQDIWPEAVMVAPAHVHAVLCGTPRREETAKQEIRAAVARYVPGSDNRDWNEHQRDALAAGLTFLHDLRRFS